MIKLLLNLVLISLGFAFLAPRYVERITFRLAIRWALLGVILLLLIGIAGVAFGQSLGNTLFVLGRGNDMQAGVIFGVVSLYISLLCGLWSWSILLRKKGGEA